MKVSRFSILMIAVLLLLTLLTVQQVAARAASEDPISKIQNPKLPAPAQPAPVALNNAPSPANSGGPDNFGYTFKDNYEPEGPTYKWIEISGTGTQIDSWSDPNDGFAGPFPLGFDFRFYENTYSELYVGTNGYVSFGQGYSTPPIPYPPPFPDPEAPNNDVAGFYRDLIIGYYPGSAVYYQAFTNPGRFVVEYVNAYDPGWGYQVTFEIILYQNGDIQTLYSNTQGLGATTGIENAEGKDGLRYSTNPYNNTVVQYYYPFGVFLEPPSQSNFGGQGEILTYSLELINRTGEDEAFNLEVLPGNQWPTTLSITQTGVISSDTSVWLDAWVEIPPDAPTGESDLAIIQAASVASPGLFVDTAELHTRAGIPGYAYVTVSSYNRVDLVDSDTHEVVDSIDVGIKGCNFPWRATMTPDGNHVFVSCYNSGSVAVIETASSHLVGYITDIPSADDVAFTRDGAYALVGSGWSNQIAVVDTSTYNIVNWIYTNSYTRSLASHPYLPRVYVTCGDGTILVVDTTTFTIDNIISVGGTPWDVAVSPQGEWIFSGDRWGAGLTVINAESETVYTTVSSLGYLTGLEVAPDGSMIYANALWNGVHFIDGQNFINLMSVYVPGEAWESELTCDGEELFVGNSNDAVPVIDTASQTWEDTIYINGWGTRGIAICPQHVLNGLFLSPQAQHNQAGPGHVVAHQETLINATGASDSFNLELGAHTWDTGLSDSLAGPLADGETITFTVFVTVPLDAPWYATDFTVVTATSVTSPTDYIDTASFTTEAYAPPQVDVSPDSLSSSLLMGETEIQELTVSNLDGITLTFNIQEGGRYSGGLNPVVRSSRPRVEGVSSLVKEASPDWASNEKRIQGAPVLIIQDGYPWGYDSIQQVLNANGIVYDQVTSWDLPYIDLFDYQMVIIPSSQSTDFYNNYGASLPNFGAFVENGGKLWLSMCTQGQTPLILGGVQITYSPEDYNTITQLDHPWVAGAPEHLLGSSASHTYFTNLAPGSLTVAVGDNSGNATLVDYRMGEGRIMLTGMTLEFAWANGWDAAPILENTLIDMYTWAPDVPWLTESPTSGALAGGESLLVDVIFDASEIQPGDHLASLLVRSNDPDEPIVEVPVSLTVTPSPTAGWVEGYVSDSRSGFPLEAEIIAQGLPYLIVSDPATGYYKLWLEPGSYTLEAFAEDYVIGVADVDITTGQGSLQDFILELNAPLMVVSPTSLEATQFVGEVTEHTLTIADQGPVALDFQIGVGGERTVSLDQVLSSLNANFQGVVDAIPNRFDFDEGETGYQIGDGGNDMYDGGNMLSTNLGGYIYYSDGTIQDSSFFGPEGRYFTNKYPGLFVMVADLEGIDSFYISGDLGADGMGNLDATVLQTELNGVTYYGFVKRVYNAYDPSVNHLVIVADNPGANHEFDLYTNNDYHRVYNLMQNKRLYYLLYASANGGYIDDVATLNIMRTFLQAIPLSSTADWLSVDPQSGQTPPYSETPVQVTFDAGGMQPGEYTALLSIAGNDPLMPFVSVMATMNVEPTADMGQVAGTVYNAWSGEPLTATVELQGVFDMLARPDFNIWAVEGTYTLMAYASGYVTATQTVEIVAGEVTEQGLYLEPALPRLEIAAEAIDAQVVQGLVGEQTYVISNTGAVPLDFSLHEISPTLSLSRQQPASLSGKRILYDSYHGAWWIGNYSQLIEDLTEAGAEVVENYSEINESILENFDVLWVSCCGGPWGDSELQAVDAWLNQGGAVLVESEWSNAAVQLGNLYGIDYMNGPCSGGTTNNILDHPTTIGVEAIYYDWTCTYLDGEASILIYDWNGAIHAMAKEDGPGKMVTIADSDFLNWVYNYNDNHVWAMNTFTWLADPAYSDVAWLSMEPVSGTLRAHSQQAVALTFDASKLSPGIYEAELAIEHSDPALESPILLPVELTVVARQAAVALAPDALEFQGYPGDVLTYHFSLTNLGNAPDSFSLEASGAWPVELSADTTGELQPGESFDFTLEVTIPADADEGDKDTILIKAVSDSDPDADAGAQATAFAAWRKVYLPMTVK